MSDVKKIVFITPHDAQYGFSLAGVTQYEVIEDTAEEFLETLVKQSEIGLIVIDERLTRNINEKKLREFEEVFSGLLIVLPSPIKPVYEALDYVSKLIKRAIGYYVRLS